MMDLEESRKEIDRIDRELTHLFEERLKAASEVAAYKKEKGLPIFDAKREAMVLDRTAGYLEDATLESELRLFYQNLMDLTKMYEKDLLTENFSVGYQGVEGAFSSLAVTSFFHEDPHVEKRAYHTFSDVFEALKQGEIKYGVIPIDNSSTGSVSANYDLLKNHNVFIIEETQIAAKQMLLVLPGTRLEDIKQVYSHPQGLAQTSDFLESHINWRQVPYGNTATSAKYVSEQKDPSLAAIASKEAAEIYGLEVLDDKITNSDKNFTRFLKIGRSPEPSDLCSKITVIFSVQHAAGSLFQALRTISENGVNMLRLESRPIADRTWEYLFYLDLEGNINDPKVQKVLEKLQEETVYYKYLGNYPREVF